MELDGKICSTCCIFKIVAEFRVRVDRKSPYLKYLNDVCKDCEKKKIAEKTKEYKKTEVGRRKHNEAANKFYKRHKDKVRAYQKKHSEKEDSKEKRKIYIEKNKDKIQSQERLTKKKYQEKHVSGITDTYAANLLKQDEKEVTPETIEI